MTACNVFPKVSGDCAYDAEYNALYSGALSGCAAISASLENAMNIAKLQYTLTLTDISHDYMVVDIMTDTTGYNNTVCIGSTTSAWCCPTGCSATCGYYTNLITTTTAPTNTQLSCAVTGTGVVTISNYSTCTFTGNGAGTATVCTCIGTPACITSYCSFCFCTFFCVIADRSTSNTMNAQINVTNWQDNYCCCVHVDAGTAEVIQYCSIRCYCYTRVSAGCYCFYCNGTGVCQLALTNFPNIIACSRSDGDNDASCTRYCMTGIVYSTFDVDKKIVTTTVTYASNVKAVYLDKESYGTGTITYNVINATGGACLCTGLLPNCTYTMTCCVACHIYEILQCNNAVSCIKSYAFAVTKV